jgi:hypothetical protein
VSFERSESDPRNLDSLPGQVEIRREARRSGIIASGTLACPDCDAPVAPVGTMTLAASLWCPLCGRVGRVRDFLSLEPPTRPARVVVRVSGARALT